MKRYRLAYTTTTGGLEFSEWYNETLLQTLQRVKHDMDVSGWQCWIEGEAV